MKAADAMVANVVAVGRTCAFRMSPAFGRASISVAFRRSDQTASPICLPVRASKNCLIRLGEWTFGGATHVLAKSQRCGLFSH